MHNVIYIIEVEGYSKVYIGSAVDFRKRISVHLHHLRNGKHQNPHLQRVFDKYSEDAFAFRIVENLDTPDTLLMAEQKWIDSYDFDDLINICPTAGSTLGRLHSKESKKRISDNHHDVSGNNNPMYGLTGSLSPNYGRTHSDETKQKISESLKGKNTWSSGKKRPKHSERMKGENNPFFGQSHSDETKTKMKEAKKKSLRERGGKKLTLELVEEIRLRYSEGNITVTALAKEYGLNRTYMTGLLKGKYWNND